ncbi:carbohydrate porin [Pectobacterium sp. A5351]|uniref:carbohydrate porin n=1 Tax=Pectobacterium sp. A5351 TaxID=2914983 RepID=UPI003FA75C4C
MWLETGYQEVDYEYGASNSGWKVTLSQNISFAMRPNFRSMLRFYVTDGGVNSRHTKQINPAYDDRRDSLNVGAMWEA